MTDLFAMHLLSLIPGVFMNIPSHSATPSGPSPRHLRTRPPRLNHPPAQQPHPNQFPSLLTTLLCLAAFTLPLQAQWTTQTILLQPGWNAVYLEVQPEPRAAQSLFAGVPVESVWRRTQPLTTVQFVQYAELLMPDDPGWLVYFPAANALSAQNTLHVIHGAHAYLIKLPTSAAPVNLPIKGRPLLRSPVWASGSLNLVGATLGSGSSYRVNEYFAVSPPHANQPVYRLSASGHWERAAGTDLLRPGEAFWVRSVGDSSFEGPIKVTVEQRTGLDYGQVSHEQPLTVRNDSAQSRTITIRLRDSEAISSSEMPALAGNVPLFYWRPDFATLDYSAGESPWAAVHTQIRTLAPGATWSLRLSVDRRLMAAYAGPIPAAGVLYQSLLEITDDKGARRLVPVTAASSMTGSPTPHRLGTANLRPMSETTSHPRAGLWVGYAIANAVSETAHPSDPISPTPTAEPFQFRLLMHVDQAGQLRLLQQVIQMWKPGTFQVVPDPANPAQTIRRMVEQGRPVLLTDPALVHNYSGITLSDGLPVGRRMSSAAFSFKDPAPMTLLAGPGFGETDATIAAMIEVPFDDPLNPYLHRYHPDHDNLSEEFTEERQETFALQRDLRFTFTDSDPEGYTLAGWGVERVGGRFRESIAGLHRPGISIEIGGIFRLHRVSRVPTLNDEQLVTVSAR